MIVQWTIVKDWITKAGYRAVIVMTPAGHHCGYVAVPKTHPLYGQEYSTPCAALTFPAGEKLSKRGILALITANGEARPEVVFDVHGGITYSSNGNGKYPITSSDVWWFGYDCAHYGDSPSNEFLAQQRIKYPDLPAMWSGYEGIFRDVDYNIGECESLAEQLTTRVNFNIGA